MCVDGRALAGCGRPIDGPCPKRRRHGVWRQGARHRDSQEFFFGVENVGGEVAETEFREGTLRDLARLTGGRYFHYSEIDRAHDVVLADKLPTSQKKVSLTDNFLFLALLVGLIGAEWILRRQSGLR